MNGYLLDYAEVSWRDPFTPVSTRFGDIYWSGGLEEKQFVFIEGNHVAARSRESGPPLIVGEVGFGFGLNFLLTAMLWRKRESGDGRRLHYIAIENYPVSPDDLAALYARLSAGQPDLNGLADRLLAQYPLATPGAHTRWLDEDICLTLIFDDVEPALANLQASVDLWYLDGFSPAVNESIWNANVYRALVSNSAPGATLSTYTAAGHVRRGLTEAGFHVQRRPGFGQKAEMLQAGLPGSAPSILRTPEVAIIGAGIAGLFCARSLAQRGIRATILEAGDRCPGGASSINQMAVYPQLALQPGPWNYFSLAAFQYLCASEPAMRATGFNLVPETPERQDRLVRLASFFPDSFLEYADEDRLEKTTGLPVRDPGAIYHTAGWLDLELAFGEVLAGPNVRTGSRVEDLKATNDGWQLIDNAGKVMMEAEDVIIATGEASMPILSFLPLSTVRGQSIVLRIPSSQQPKSILAGPVTLFPPKDGLCTLSATYEPDSTDLSVRQADTEALLEKLGRLLPDLEYKIQCSMVGLRSVPRDRMPVVGQVPDPEALAAWKAQRHRRGTRFHAHLDGLYVCGGFGSHGATHAKLCAEHLTAQICGEPSPLGREWSRLLAPERF